MNFRYMPYSGELANMILNHKDINNKSDFPSPPVIVAQQSVIL